MELHLTSEQSLLRDSAAKFAGAAGPRVARGLRGKSPSFSPARLREAGEAGWLGMLVPASADGPGLGLTELALVLEQAGRELVCEPIGLAAIAAAALAQGHAPHSMLPRVMRGEALVVPATQESAHAGDPRVLRTQAAGDRAPRLTGPKCRCAPTGPTDSWSAPPRRTAPHSIMWRARRPAWASPSSRASRAASSQR